MTRDEHTDDETDTVVRTELAALLKKTGIPLELLTDELRLDEDLSLSSLDLTALLVTLTERLGFTGDVTTDVDIATVGDLRRAFRRSDGPPDAQSDTLMASRRRAEARRAGRQ
jgi:acyl carrier protein